ncbi:MAG TPA: hypothetical protein VED63_11415, partial [Acidimicrobiales bacterium]|nr:hypothetical protein [Acidimicrobiales bacterium]
MNGRDITEGARQPVPADHTIGSFSSDPPWIIDPDHLTWSSGIDSLRARMRAEVPGLTRRRAVPPGLRV